jgi:nucleoside-triphosphatase
MTAAPLRILLGDHAPSGFFTRERREGGSRIGFDVESFSGEKGTLARAGLAGARARVGRYGVDLESFERVALPALEPRPDIDLYLIDEIGKMECFSRRFIESARTLLALPVPLVATVALRGAGFIAEVKARPDAEVIALRPAERGALPEKLAARLRSFLGDPRPADTSFNR